MVTKSIFDTDFSIVKDEPPGNSSKVVKHLLLGLQKTLSILTQTGHDKDVAAIAEPAAEYLNSFPLSLQVNGSFAPVDLNGVARIIFQRHICLSRDILNFHFMNHTAHNGVRAGEILLCY